MTLHHVTLPAAAADPAPSRAAFDAPRAATVGLEEELMLLDPATLDLAPLAGEALALLGGDERYKPELVAAQIESATAPCPTVAAAAAALRRARADLAAALAGRARVAAAGLHPFAAALGALQEGPRYAELSEEMRTIAPRQLVFGLHVHVAVTGAERAVAVHDALRSYLPELAALAANAPFHDGRDSAMASLRPAIASMLPRQGIPPALGSWEAYESALRWGAEAGALREPRRWWWELRLHPTLGTVEVRVADAQTTVGETAAFAAVVHALVVLLAERADAGELPPAADSWRLAENRWWAACDGLEATLADPLDGRREPARERLGRLLDELAPVAARLRCSAELEQARALAAGPGGAARQRAQAAGGDLRAVAAWLAGRLLE